MTEPAAELYTLSGATGEILIILLVSFVLGVLLGRLLVHNQPQHKQALLLREPTAAPLPPLPLRKDDLKVIEGIGPRIEALLYEHGILTLRMLAHTPIDRLIRILENAGTLRTASDPHTWHAQALLAAEQKWEELKRLQKELV